MKIRSLFLYIFLVALLNSCNTTIPKSKSFSGYKTMLDCSSIELKYPLIITYTNVVYRNISYDNYSRTEHRDITYDSIQITLLNDSTIRFTNYPIQKKFGYLGGLPFGLGGLSGSVNINAIPEFDAGFAFSMKMIEVEKGERLFVSAYWTCFPWCRSMHGHISENLTVYYSTRYGPLFLYNDQRSYPVMVLYSIDGKRVKSESIAKVLRSKEFSEDFTDHIWKQEE